MPTITLVSSNPQKVIEAQSILIGTDIVAQGLDLPEIQSFNLEEIVRAKAEAAYQQLQSPVLVDDVAMDISVLKGFPGPFVKFWEKNVGYDLAVDIGGKFEDHRAVVRCGVGYADGSNILYTEGIIAGQLVARRNGEGFGFDFYFIPDGYNQTFGEMGREAKNKISHRYLAFAAMKTKLKENGIV